MFSSDQNIETVARMLQSAKRYGEMRLDSFERTTVSKLSQVFSALIALALALAFGLIALVFASCAIVVAIAPHVGGLLVALLIMAGVYAVLAMVVYAGRHSLIARPIVRYFNSLFFAERAHRPVPTEEEMMEARRQMMSDYDTLTAPPPPAANAFEQAMQTASKAWTIADGLVTGYKLYKRFRGIFRRRR